MRAIKFLLIFQAVLLLGCDLESGSVDKQQSGKLDSLWTSTVKPYLQAPLWHTDYNYDSGQILMPAVYYAFATKDQKKIADFDKFYQRYAQQISTNLDPKRLKQLQFWYLMSQYLVLSHDSGRWDSDKQLLLDFVTEYLKDLWLYRPIHVYGIHTKGLRERVIWKLDNPDYQPMYKRATFDEEFFSFAIAADFIRIDRMQDSTGKAALQDIVDTALKVFESEVEYTADGWLYQPGQWWDNEDYLYAGHDTLENNLDPSPIPGIATDSNHSHRLPLWLRSLENAYSSASDEALYYRLLREGFASQFINVVYVQPTEDFSGMRMTNFMDGRNGIYRYGFHKDSPTAIKLGYEQFNLSGTLFTGFYPLMESDYLKEQYRKQCAQFPLSEKLVNLYQGLGPARAAHPLVSMPEFYYSGFAELNCLIAITIPSLD